MGSKSTHRAQPEPHLQRAISVFGFTTVAAAAAQISPHKIIIKNALVRVEHDFVMTNGIHIPNPKMFYVRYGWSGAKRKNK